MQMERCGMPLLDVASVLHCDTVQLPVPASLPELVIDVLLLLLLQIFVVVR